MKRLLNFLLLPALLAIGAMSFAPTAQAEDGACFDRSNLIDALVDDYGEQLAEVHEIEGRGLLEFHVSPTDGTWTAVLSDDDATVSCVLATGEGLDLSQSPLFLTTGERI